MKDNCEHGWNGSCCCNCAHQRKLMKHPSNQTFGQGRISETCGFVCTVVFEDQSNEGKAFYFDKEHGMCELHKTRQPNTIEI